MAWSALPWFPLSVRECEQHPSPLYSRGGAKTPHTTDLASPLDIFMTTICLCAIFRNEANNVQRCLDAAAPIIDYVSICDTGSTDNTAVLIEDWGRRRGIPTRIHSEPFRDFGHNRTRSVDLARQTFPAADYLLLLDADMVLKVEPDWCKDCLTADHYLVRQVNPFIEYWNTRLVRAALPWRCVGVTHEYWECPEAGDRERLNTLWFDDRGDGGYKADKFTRDKRLLTATLEDPHTPAHLRTRYLFYLAQTYRDLNEHQVALEWYGQRVAAGGWAEEVYVAQCERAYVSREAGTGQSDPLF